MVCGYFLPFSLDFIVFEKILHPWGVLRNLKLDTRNIVTLMNSRIFHLLVGITDNGEYASAVSMNGRNNHSKNIPE